MGLWDCGYPVSPGKKTGYQFPGNTFALEGILQSPTVYFDGANKKVMDAVTSFSVYSFLLLLCASFLSLFPVDGLLGRGRWKTG